MELLCPAGNMDSLHAAIDNGANAVYLGFTNFGARASAVNFDEESLAKAVEYAHLYHARIYVTVNTLIKPDEIEELYQTLHAISMCRADAVLVQDITVAQLARRHFPLLQLHASTQMALCNAEGAKFARTQGFSRIVLARECSLQDIRDVCATGIEGEVFAHGALCTAVSGRCLMSSMAGGRSGNRGRCAQPCRQSFDIFDSISPWLSLRDLCLLEDLPALQSAGVASIKIEGRLKSPEYVAVVTDVYRRALDEMARGQYSSHPEEMLSLRQIFNRGAFTRGHAMGAEDSDLVSGARVSHEGVIIGKITSVRKNMAQILISADLHNEDSLQLRGKAEYETRYSGPEVPAGQTALLRLREDIHAEKGMLVARLADSTQLKRAREHQPPKIPVQMKLTCRMDQPLGLQMGDGTSSVIVDGEIAREAHKKITSDAEFKKQLMKLGDSPFKAESFDISIDSDNRCFSAVSALNELRRKAVESLKQKRIDDFCSRNETNRTLLSRFERTSVLFPENQNTLAVLFRNIAQTDTLQKNGATHLIYDAPEFTEKALSILSLEGVWLRIPPQLSQSSLHWLIPFLQKKEQHLAGLWIESIGMLHLPVSLPVIAGEGIPVCSPVSAEWISGQGVSAFSIWPEWTGNEAAQLIPAELPAFIKIYGRESLMLLHHCPKRVSLGLHQNRNGCRLCSGPQQTCAQDFPILKDQKNHTFPLIRTRFDEGCEINVLNCLPTDLYEQLSRLRKMKLLPLLRFTNEEDAECAMITRAVHDLLNSGKTSKNSICPNSTLGHWIRGVE